MMVASPVYLDDLRQATGAGPASRGETGVLRRPHTGAGRIDLGACRKTWLAVHWANLYRDHIPDGQLFADLAGSTRLPSRRRPPRWIAGSWRPSTSRPVRPTDTDAQSALYRSLVVDKRMLIVLDNTRDYEQVSGLLPGSRPNRRGICRTPTPRTFSVATCSRSRNDRYLP
jgi:hypothetical protein